MAKIKTRLKRNGAYWRKRAEAQEKRVHSDNEQAFRDIEKAFKRALSDMEKDILRWYQRFADNNEISLQEARRLLKSDELQELKWDVQEYIRRGEENAISGEWEKQLENASARWHVSRLEALQIRTRQAMEVAFNAEQVTLEQYLKTRYTESYYRTAYEFQTSIGEGWNMGKIDTRKLDLVVSKPWTADGKEFSARIWEQRDRLVNVLHQELTRNCILGRSPEEAVKVVANEMGKTIQQARRLVMTESAYVHAASQRDCYSDLGVEAFEIVATLDSHTSTICQNMDGKHFPASQYEVGVTVPPFHPNCRSVTCPYFDDEFTVGETRAAKSKDGKTVQVPSDMKYPEWKERFVDGGEGPKSVVKSTALGTSKEKNGLENNPIHGTIKSGAISGALNPDSKEADEHAKRYYGLVRSMKTDVERIAQNTGIAEEQIRKIKEFLFLEEHDLGGKEPEHFAPDYRIAESWQRLMLGTPEPHDLALLRHEIMERELMEQGYTQDEAHIAASKAHNYAREADEYHGKIEKHSNQK